MNGAIVNIIAESRHILTVETREDGVTKSVPANLDGTAVMHDGVMYASQTHPKHVEVFLDSISGNHFAKVLPSQLPILEAEGTKVYQGVGGVHGWFVEAPDFTISGRHGGKPASRKAVVHEPAQYGGPDPNASLRLNPRPAKKAAKKSAKKAAKKTTKETSIN